MGPPNIQIGVDVGQKVDPTAIAVSEIEWRPRTEAEGAAEDKTPVAHHVIRFLQRLPLGTPYHPDVAARLAEVVTNIRARPLPEGQPPLPITMVIDATGVGTPIVDVLREPLRDKHVRLEPATFNHGDRLKYEEGELRMGKAWLVSRLQALLQTKRIHLPETAEARSLERELLDYEIRIDEDANDRYGAFKVGTHDDLVTALGLACYWEPPVSAAPTGIMRRSPWDPMTRLGGPLPGQRSVRGWP